MAKKTSCLDVDVRWVRGQQRGGALFLLNDDDNNTDRNNSNNLVLHLCLVFLYSDVYFPGLSFCTL